MSADPHHATSSRQDPRAKPQDGDAALIRGRRRPGIRPLAAAQLDHVEAGEAIPPQSVAAGVGWMVRWMVRWMVDRVARDAIGVRVEGPQAERCAKGTMTRFLPKVVVTEGFPWSNWNWTCWSVVKSLGLGRSWWSSKSLGTVCGRKW